MYSDPEKRREHDRKKYAENPKYYNENGKRSYQKHKEKRLAYHKKYREENRENRLIYYKKYHAANKEKRKQYKRSISERTNEQERIRTATDINFKLKKNLRRRIHHALTGTIKKVGSTIELIGCTIEQLKSHLESLFTEGMSWDNYGQWHIDHYYPCSFFILTDYQEQKFCFHYTNLRPLWAKDNMSKNDKLPPEIINN